MTQFTGNTYEYFILIYSDIGLTHDVRLVCNSVFEIRPGKLLPGIKSGIPDRSQRVKESPGFLECGECPSGFLE